MCSDLDQRKGEGEAERQDCLLETVLLHEAFQAGGDVVEEVEARTHQ